MNARNVYAMILAAGHGRRMGQIKQLMPYGDGTMLDSVIDAVMQAPIDGLVLVANPQVAGEYEGVFPERCFIAINESPDSAMLASVKIGWQRLQAEFSPSVDDGVMVLLADQPQIGAGTIATCAQGYRMPRNAPGILIATYKGRRGHPAVFSANLLGEIEDFSDDQGLNDLAKRHPRSVRQLPITAGPMPIDVNTPDDYTRLMESG